MITIRDQNYSNKLWRLNLYFWTRTFEIQLLAVHVCMCVCVCVCVWERERVREFVHTNLFDLWQTNRRVPSTFSRIRKSDFSLCIYSIECPIEFAWKSKEDCDEQRNWMSMDVRHVCALIHFKPCQTLLFEVTIVENDSITRWIWF